MPPVTRVITARLRNAPAETIKTLHAELAAVGMPGRGKGDILHYVFIGPEPF